MAKQKAGGAPGADTASFWLPGLVAESVLVYLFWTTFTMMIPTIWFAPMDKMVRVIPKADETPVLAPPLHCVPRSPAHTSLELLT